MGKTLKPCCEYVFMPPRNLFRSRTITKSAPGDMPEADSLAPPEDISLGAAPRGGIAYEQAEAQALAASIRKAGMAGPAAIALRVAGPLSWIGGQMLWAVQPLLQGLGISSRTGGADSGSIPRLARFLEGEGNVAELVRCLEADAEVKPRPRHTTGSEHGPV